MEIEGVSEIMPKSKCVKHGAAQLLSAGKGNTINSYSDTKENDLSG